MTSLQQVVTVIPCEVVLEKKVPQWMLPFEDYLKTADLTQYEKVNPSARFSVDSKRLKLTEEGKARSS